jgi:ABC-type dipeptide/oligopeptide/nickel transport system permease component
VTLIGLQAAAMLSGAVTVEFVFAWPGLGLLALDAVSARDIPLVQAVVIFGVAAFVLINLTVDLIYGVIDPRIRTEQ